MKAPTLFRAAVPLMILALSALSGCGAPESPDNETGKQPDGVISAGEVWARPAGEGMTGGVYLSLYNRTGEADTLTGVEADIASRADLHESFSEEGITGMRPAGSLSIPAGGDLVLEPGGYHIMLMRMTRSVEPGDSLEIRLGFARSGTLRVRVPVRLNQDQSP